MEQKLATQEKQIDAQMFVMNNLRNGIDFLKEQCSAQNSDNGNLLAELASQLNK